MLKKNLFFFIVFTIGMSYAQTAKNDLSLSVEKLQDSAFIQLHYDNFYDAFKVLDSSSVLLERSDNYRLKSKNCNIYGLAYAQINEYNKAKKFYAKAIKYSDSIINEKDKLDRKLSASLNLQRLYVITRDYDAYYKAYSHVRDMALLNKTNTSIFHEYDTEVILLKEKKNYAKLLELCVLALREIEERKDLFDRTDYDELNRVRIKSNYEIHYAIALMELGFKTEEANKLFSSLIKSDLENILWKKTSQFKNLADIRYYKALYFIRYKKNQDSARYYLKKYNEYVENTLLYIEEEEHKSSRYLVENIENRTMVEKSNLLLKIEKKNSFKIKIISISIGTILVLSLILLYAIRKAGKTQKKANLNLEHKNRKLQLSIIKQKELENKIENIQEIIARDLHDNFGNRIAGINSAATILMDFKKGDNYDEDEHKKFLKHLNKGVLHLNADIKDLIWANNFKNNSLSEVILRLQLFVNEFKKTVNCSIKFEKNIDANYVLPQFWNRQILLIFKEAINNACKHTKCKTILITIEAVSHTIKIIAKDSGSGFDVKNVSRKSGINNMKKRAESIGCQLKIHSTIDGTEVIFIGEIEDYSNSEI